jgi:hypothetical protein
LEEFIFGCIDRINITVTTTTTMTAIFNNNHRNHHSIRGTKVRMVMMFFVASVLLLIAPPTVDATCSDPCVPGSEDIMKPKAHGTSEKPVQADLRYGCDYDTADR